MTKAFDAFLRNNINEELASRWENSIIKKIEAWNKEKIWRLYIEVADLLNGEEIDNTARQIKECFSFLARVEICQIPPAHSECIGKIIDRCVNNTENSLFPQSANWLALECKTEDGRIDLIASDSLVYKDALNEDICTQLAEWFWQHYRLHLVVRILLAQENNTPALNNNYIPDRPVNVLEYSQPADRGVKRNRKNNISKAAMIRIDEVQEGMSNVVVEGEVWDKNVRRINDGLCIVTYSVYDYTSTLLIKSFYKKISEDTVKIGEWFRFSGDIRYDKFSAEVMMNMNSCQKIKKEKRQDKSDVKRVELHAHTKMSSMDGLTEVNELIECAARWGHPAIAITDHGCIQAFPDAYKAGKKHGIKIIYGVEAYLAETDRKEKPWHIILLAINQTGLFNIYKLITASYIDSYYRRPKILRNALAEKREGIMIGSACEAGELYSAVAAGAAPEELERIASFYDYLEVMPLSNNQFLINDGRVADLEGLKNNNRLIVELGEKLGKPVVATGDVHFLEPHHEIFRRIIQAGQGYEDAESQAPLYFKTTDEMLEDFSYLGELTARRIVIENPNLINDSIESLKPVIDGFYPPRVEGAEEEIKAISYENAYRIYGDELPGIVTARLEHELNAIIKHGFSVLYYIAHKLVKKSNEDGYIVGSRGSVGSSLVAYFTGITEVNPLIPHYVCPQCRYSNFDPDQDAACGVDLQDRECPECGSALLKEGFDIPFETFLGFDGNKTPDIDLNFSGEYQSRAHQYVEELFGADNVFRAGTVSTIADKTAYGFVKNYFKERQTDVKDSEANRLVKGISGVKKTTGQHPGGLIVVPKGQDINQFTPLQHPAEKKDSGIITTHFEYHALEDQLVKLDILGHDDPTVIKALEDMTGIKASAISLCEPETMRLFSDVSPLGVAAQQIGTSVGTYGIPEFGTKFVRQMLETTRPSTFEELIRISGLSHGTDVWSNNAENLIKNKIAGLKEAICIRDDIMTYLIRQGMEKLQAFNIMEKVRKGKDNLNEQEVDVMLKHQVPAWYIESCDKIKYMFPKAHAVAYVTMAFRIAYFKVHYPREFYASFFSIRADDFEAEAALQGYDRVRLRIKEIEKMGFEASPKDKNLLPILELVLEMLARGYVFYPIDIYKSDARKFIVLEKGLLMPFSALPNVGAAAAQGIVQAREQGEFLSIKDFQQRTRLNKTGMDILRKLNCFGDLPEESQISLFG
ncbi:MAG TPA: PolC-type DNA polymerase III [Syntrophomonadaceae bacterium]|nr:PolC-type DNA polymerase III [Syntrophomonadaceae bacterium]HPR93067.1 PolC-type DNA polymerase III [Syntrophomonadaceae bacterium]